MNLTDDDKKLIKRLEELADRAERRYQPAYSEFLTLAEQSLLPWARGNGVLSGGWENAERRIACFGEDAELYPPIVCLRIAPLNRKFAEDLSHRDFLGALMSLGIRREVMGDILPHEGGAYLFCLDSIADYICRELTQIRRTSVKCEVVDAPPEAAVPVPKEREVVITSVRLDALISAVWNLSRSEGQTLLTKGLVFINGREAMNASLEPKENDIISVRGKGRFVFSGVARETKKGRLRASVKVYGT